MKNSELYEFELNFGMQQSSSCGLMRLKTLLDGERIKDIDVNVGFLHRAVEKILENKTYLQVLPYFERLNYISPLFCVHAFVMAVEKLLKLNIPSRASYLRVLMLELNRISGHFFVIANMLKSLAADVPLSFAIEIREEIYELFEKISGARIHNNYITFGGVAKDINSDVLESILNLYINKILQAIDNIEDFTTNNPVFKQRTVDIGKIDKDLAVAYGFSGAVLRACGVDFDLRRDSPYECYGELDFNVITAKSGDCYSRYLLKVYEIRESVKIIKQIIEKMPQGSICSDNHKIIPPSKDVINEDAAAMIHYFSLYTKGFTVPQGEVYTFVEAPFGEFGVFLVSDGSNVPYRCKIRSPGFAHLQALPVLAKDHLLPDINVIISSLGVVLGEIDR